MSTTLLVTAIPVAVALGTAAGYLATRRTVERLRAELADAAWQLTHDPLTGLLNRIGLRTAHTAVAAGPPRPLIVILLDLDRFKEVNDAHGHDAGDDLLMEVADRLGHLADAAGGTAARLSGDEFAAILPLRHHRLDDLADQITTAIAAPVTVQAANGPVTVTVTASVGMTITASTDRLEDGPLHRADTAMYQAKHHGGDRHLLYTPGMVMPEQGHRRGPRPRDLRRDRSGGVE
ncbi:GGDEF domain-containing protein [Micromonospora matsumotoense]|uniref:GGDEF domain-containing protein n=1 Tax=Micromonospora matsumotoense TaxID=121616 RepID=UPI00340AEB59